MINKEVKEGLAALPPDASLRPADEFWSDFKARAHLRRQDVPQPERSRLGLAWAIPAACAAALLLAAGLHVFSSGSAGAGGVIKSIEVIASHSAVLIMEDDVMESTVLWIVDMEPVTPNGDDT